MKLFPLYKITNKIQWSSFKNPVLFPSTSCYQSQNRSSQISQNIYNSRLTNKNKMPPPVVYRSVESVLGVLNNHKKVDNTQAVNSLLDIYNDALRRYQNEHDANAKKHPLIILEGLDGCGKSTTGKRLASNLKAVNWCTPPKSTRHIRHLFDNHQELQTAYYTLGNYIAALEVAVIIQKQPVVMDRYWHSTAAYGIAQAVHDFPDEVEMPPQGDAFYSWPNDLLKPDAVLFLNVSENVRIERLSRRTEITTQEKLLRTSSQFRNNIILAYRNMVNPEVTFIDGDPGFNAVLQEINGKIEHLFK